MGLLRPSLTAKIASRKSNYSDTRSLFYPLVIMLLLTIVGTAEASTINAASGSLADVRTAVSLAADSDTVLVPAGTFTWTSALSISKAITLQGAGIDRTIIIDEVPRSTNPCRLIVMGKPPLRLTGFTLQKGTVNTGGSTGGCVVISGTAPTGSLVRVDHIKFSNITNTNLRVFGAMGVIDHCTFNRGYTNAIVIWHHNWGGKSYGDDSWTEQLYLGTDKALYVEDCTFTQTSQYGGGCVDCFTGGRYVFRHNTVYDDFVLNHEGGVRNRGARSFEIYDNTFINSHVTNPDVFLARAGTGVVFNNTCTGPYTNVIHAQNYRSFRSEAFWGGASGVNGWDSNDPHGVYASGTHTGANGAPSLTKTNAGWTTNQWKGYILRNVTKSRSSEITSNTSDTISYMPTADSNFPNMIFDTGNSFEIRQVVASLDQVGRGTCNLLSGDNPTPVWLNQAQEPLYQWNNTLNGKPAAMGSPNAVIKENRDYFNFTPRPNYTPYTYPHPLVSASTSPAPPTNLRITTGP